MIVLNESKDLVSHRKERFEVDLFSPIGMVVLAITEGVNGLT